MCFHLARRFQPLSVVLPLQKGAANLPIALHSDRPTQAGCAQAATRGGYDCQAIQGMTECLSYTHQPIDRADLGQHMRRIRPLFATRFEPTAFLEECEHGRQKLFLSMTGDQTCAERDYTPRHQSQGQ